MEKRERGFRLLFYSSYVGDDKMIVTRIDIVCKRMKADETLCDYAVFTNGPMFARKNEHIWFVREPVRFTLKYERIYERRNNEHTTFQVV